MGAIDKFLNNLNIGNSGSDSADDYYDDYDETDEEPKRFSKAKDDDSKSGKFSKVTSIGKKKSIPGQSCEINVIKPKSVEDEKDVTDSILDNKAVLLNLTGLDRDIATRILDFANGSIYAVDGCIQMVTESIYLLAPSGVDISGSLNEADED